METATQNQKSSNYFIETHAKVLGLFLMKQPIDPSHIVIIKVFSVEFQENNLNVIFSLIKNAPDLTDPSLYDMIMKLL